MKEKSFLFELNFKFATASNLSKDRVWFISLCVCVRLSSLSIASLLSLSLLCLYIFYISLRSHVSINVIFMVFILDGCSFHVAHV